MRALLAALILLIASAPDARAEAKTLVMVNGKPMPVFFNDGDSFRVLEGGLSGTRARLAGFNTLESHGPVHRWGAASAKEMYVIAKMATLFGRRGTWTCNSELEKDTYGRALFECPDLREALVRKGLAHAMTVTAEPASDRLLEAQREAQEAGRGLWSQGVPRWIITSLHSIDERPDKPTAYNRIVSTRDGHSEKWRHTRQLKECEEVCLYGVKMDEMGIKKAAQAIRADPRIAPFLVTESWFRPARHFGVLLEVYGMTGSIAHWVPKEMRETFRTVLKELEEAGHIVFERGEIQSCMIYVPFKRWHGNDRAKCLR